MFVARRPDGRLAALKVFRHGFVDVPPELAALTALPSHENIIPVPEQVSFSSLPSRPVLAFPLFPCDLHAFVEKRPLTELETASALRQLFSALAHMHAHGFSHNDVKLENVFLRDAASGIGPDRSIVLGDFGLAMRSLRGRKVVGTDLFMSPELFDYRRKGVPAGGYDASAADVWAAAVVGMMCLTLSGVGWTNGALVYPEEFQTLTGLSENARDFFACALKVVPRERPSAASLLEHPFLQVSQDAAPAAAPARTLSL